MNYFAPKSAAERYSRGRPYFHENTISRIKKYLRFEEKLDKALDIACGTGLSTKALLAIAENVYGTDTSEEMLKLALQNRNLNFSIAPAENQPFADREFDLITVSSGVHWFNIDKFLREANRILKPNSWLMIYDNFFISEMNDVNEFSKWFPEIYLKRFPSPPRNENFEWTNEHLKHINFTFTHEEKFKNSVSFTKKELILYFTTQSNVTSIVEKGINTYSEIEKWLDNELSPFFSTNNKRTVNFGNWIKFLQRNS